MNDITQQPVLEDIQNKSEIHLRTWPTRAGLNRRIQQIAGMVELAKQLPDHADLIEPLQAHQHWLERKIKAWPI